MPQYFSPVGNSQITDANGDPLVGGQIETYIAGSSTPAATYTDIAGSVLQSNPIILNALGFPALGPIWLTGGTQYKFIIKDALGATLRSIDSLAGINDASVSQSEWVESGLTPTYINGTSFSVPGDQTGVLQINRRVRTQNTSGFIYSTISNSAFAAGITTVTLTNDSGTLDAGLSSVAYSLLSASPSSVPTVAIAGGGTGQTTAYGARGALEAAKDIQPVTASVGSNALTLTLNPTALDFRNATLGSGAVATRTVSTAINLVISSGSTLGTTNGVLARLAVLAIDNAGTVELAVSNLFGAVNLDETGVISTIAEGGAGAADSATVVYSTTARTNVPYRIVGFVEVTEATAGTWATAPSKILTGAAPLAQWIGGYGQTRQNVLASRALSTTYTNTTGREIKVSVVAAVASSASFTATLDGIALGPQSAASAENRDFSFTVAPGETYILSLSSGSLVSWVERR